MLSALAITALIAAHKPAAATLQNLGRPVTAGNILAGLVTVNPRDGKEVLILSNNNEFSGVELIVIDLETGNAIAAPAGAGVETLAELAGHRLALGHVLRWHGHGLRFEDHAVRQVRAFRG